MRRSLIRSILILGCGLAVTGRAATFSFDGEIERNPYSYHDWHTLDFVFIQVLQPGPLSITGSGGTLLDFNFGLYVLGSVVDGGQQLALAPDLTFLYPSESVEQILCDAAPGVYVIGVDPNASDWDQFDGVVPYFSSDGPEEFAQGTYHLEIMGDFAILNIREGTLPTAVPEPSSLLLGLVGALGMIRQRINRPCQ
jgi:hypothetical protein